MKSTQWTAAFATTKVNVYSVCARKFRLRAIVKEIWETEVPYWGLRAKQFADIVFRFCCRNDQSLKMSHNSPRDWSIFDQSVSRSEEGAKRHFGA